LGGRRQLGLQECGPRPQFLEVAVIAAFPFALADQQFALAPRATMSTSFCEVLSYHVPTRLGRKGSRVVRPTHARHISSNWRPM